MATPSYGMWPAGPGTPFVPTKPAGVSFGGGSSNNSNAGINTAMDRKHAAVTTGVAAPTIAKPSTGGAVPEAESTSESSSGSGGMSGWAIFAIAIVVLLILLVFLILIWVFVINDCGTKSKKSCCGCTTYPECWCFRQLNSLSSVQNSATDVNTALINPWGIAVDDCCREVSECHKCHPSSENAEDSCWSTGTRIWVANNGTGTLQEYRIHCRECRLKWKHTVLVPAPVQLDLPFAQPTGVVVNCCATAFEFKTDSGQGPAQVITVTEQGTINVYNPSVDPNTTFIVYDGSGDGKVFKGVDICEGKLFVAEFSAGNVEVYDDDFVFTTSFTDPDLVALGYMPYNVKALKCGKLVVAFALQDQSGEGVPGLGNGYIDIFSCSGELLQRLVNRGALNEPWALTPLCNESMLLVGNFGDGKINVYDLNRCDTLLHPIHDTYRNTIAIDGLWGVVAIPPPEKRCIKWKSKCDCEESRKKEKCDCTAKSICCCSQHPDQKNRSCSNCKSKSGDCPQPTLVFAAGSQDETQGLLGFLGCCPRCD